MTPSSPTPVLTCHRFMRDTGWWYANCVARVQPMRGQDTAQHIGVGASARRCVLPTLAGVVQKRQLCLALAPQACHQRPHRRLRCLVCPAHTNPLACLTPTSDLPAHQPPSSASSHTNIRNSRSLGMALPRLFVSHSSSSRCTPLQQQQQWQGTDEWCHTAQVHAILGNLIVPNGEQLTSMDPYNTTVFVSRLSPLVGEEMLRTFLYRLGSFVCEGAGEEAL
ncbi:hypothetical protein B0H14DRAFT_3525708 [Mycena olivaceomarginata]|nr:hypothetical protein B0H14DRAFT_3525708 [Mycena olivaceomarginata]